MASTPQSLTGIDLAEAAELAAQLRVDSVWSSTGAGSGHPTSSMSAADLLAMLIGRHLCDDRDNPRSDASDHLIFSKGHASPAALFEPRGGVVSDEELMTGYRRAVTDAPLEAGPRKLWVTHLAVRQMPGSGTGDELLAAAGVDAQHIESAARDLLNAT